MDAQLHEPGLNATARKIVETAARLFMQRGYTAVSINDIVKAAEITKPTLYYYFPDKEELFVQMGLHRLAAIHAELEAALASQADCAARLTAAARVLLSGRDGDIRMMRHEMAEHLAPAHQQRLMTAFNTHLFAPLCRVMQAGLAAGTLAGHSAPALTLLFLGLMEAFHGQPPGGERQHQPDLPAEMFATSIFSAETIVSLFLYGVAGRPSGAAPPAD